MARLIAVLAGVLALVLGIASPANATSSPDQGSATAYTYNDPHHSSDSPTAQTERGPPAALDRDTTHGAVDRWSRGASAWSGHTFSRAVTTYGDTARLVLVALGTSTAKEQAEADGRALTSLARSDVAANTGQKWAYRGVGRNHPGYDDALKGRVNPRSPNGTATPAQHNLGNTTDSPYTSWTRDPDVARRFAGNDGVVVRVPRGEGSPYKFEWSPDVYYEQEILIRGPVCGAQIC